MKHILTSLVILSLFLSARAQTVDTTVRNNDRYVIRKIKNSIIVASDFYFASNAITNELAKTYFLNGFITDEMKDGVSKHLNDKNRLGGDFTTELYFTNKPDSMFGCTNMLWFVGVKNINHINSEFTRDLFEVYFRGNKNYIGKDATLGEFNLLSLKYQQLQFGLGKTLKKDSAVFDFRAALGFNMGQQLVRIHSPKADVYTADIGEYLDVNAKVEIHNSDSLHKKLGSFNGFGFSTDLYFAADLKKKHYFSLSISNLGFIKWNNQSTELNADSSFRFNGIDVTQVLNFADTIKSTINVDSTLRQPFLSKRKYNSTTLFLPAKIEVLYMRTIRDNKIRAGIGASYMLNADYFPEVYLKGDYSWKNNRITLRLSYGGYTTFGTAIYYKHYFGARYNISFGSNYINALFNPDKGVSESARVTITGNF